MSSTSPLQLKELEKERITELGTSLGKKEGSLVRSRLYSGAGDLLSSTDISLRTKTKKDEDFGENTNGHTNFWRIFVVHCCGRANLRSLYSISVADVTLELCGMNS